MLGWIKKCEYDGYPCKEKATRRIGERERDGTINTIHLCEVHFRKVVKENFGNIRAAKASALRDALQP